MKLNERKRKLKKATAANESIFQCASFFLLLILFFLPLSNWKIEVVSRRHTTSSSAFQVVVCQMQSENQFRNCAVFPNAM